MLRLVGITTNPSQRKTYCQCQVVSQSNCRILATFGTSSEARAHETPYAASFGYVDTVRRPVWALRAFLSLIPSHQLSVNGVIVVNFEFIVIF